MFLIPLYSALENSVSYFDFAVWGAIAIFIQLAYAFIVTRISGKYSFNEKINEGVVSVGILMAFLSICIGLLNARFYELLKLINLSIILN